MLFRSPYDTAFNGRGPYSTLTFTGNAANNETVTLGAVTYTWKTTLTGAANEVKIGGAASNSRDNLIAAIMGTAGEGSTYGIGTVPNSACGAAVGPTGTSIYAYAYICSTLSDFLPTTETMANASWIGTDLGQGKQFKLGLRVSKNTIEDMRNAVEALAPYYINGATGNPFNWTASSADNLYFVAHTANYDWQQPLDKIRAGDVNELDKCLLVLESSARA